MIGTHTHTHTHTHIYIYMSCSIKKYFKNKNIKMRASCRIGQIVCAFIHWEIVLVKKKNV